MRDHSVPLRICKWSSNPMFTSRHLEASAPQVFLATLCRKVRINHKIAHSKFLSLWQICPKKPIPNPKYWWEYRALQKSTCFQALMLAVPSPCLPRQIPPTHSLFHWPQSTSGPQNGASPNQNTVKSIIKIHLRPLLTSCSDKCGRHTGDT